MATTARSAITTCTMTKAYRKWLLHSVPVRTMERPLVQPFQTLLQKTVDLNWLSCEVRLTIGKRPDKDCVYTVYTDIIFV
uniref:Uncharacterized protein n=1 Tax=Macrostomum lignano TaxID=282301 RepID=A0A1I8I0W2_9PLAT